MQDKKTGDCLLDAIGGSETVDLLVSAMYFHILNDSRVAHFFDGAPIPRILAHQKSFLTVALSGAGDYSGQWLAEAHSDLVTRRGLITEHFDIVIEHMRNALMELGIDADVTRKVVQRISATKPLIFGGN